MLRFGCIDQLAGQCSAVGVPLQLTQLEGGACSGDLLPLQIGPLQLLRIRLNKSVHAAGPKLNGRHMFTLGLKANPLDRQLISHGQQLPAPAIFGFDPQRRDVHLTTPSTLSLAMVSIDQKHFHQWAGELGSAGLEEEILRRNWLRVEPRRFEDLSLYLQQIFEGAAVAPGRFKDPSNSRLAQQDLLPLLVETLLQGSERAAGLGRPPARIELVKQAERWMEEHPCEPITLDTLCRQLFTSRRNLIQGFRDHLGMGPMAYLKRLRLHQIRHLLRAADPQATNIAQLAAQWGFLSPGHFSSDYRKQFGELPSKTLQCQAQRGLRH